MRGLREQLRDDHIISYEGQSIMMKTKRYMLYSVITTNKELYDSDEGKRLIDILTNGIDIDIIFVEELLNARKNTL